MTEPARNNALFDGIYQLRVKLGNAASRCESVSLTEAVMGYPESAQKYADIAAEIRSARPWAEYYMMERILQLN